MVTLEDALARSQSRASSTQAGVSAKSAASVLSEAAKEYGYLVVYAFPDLDSIIASSVAMYVCERNGIDVVVSVTPMPPKKLEHPSLLLGYPPDALEDVEVKSSHVVLVTSHQTKTGLAKVVQLGRVDSSVTALVTSAFSEVTVVGDASSFAIVAGLWKGLDAGKKAEFLGLEASIVESLELENKLRSQLTLRLFRWFEDPLEKALAQTLDPLIPGITGHEDEASKLLASDPRLAKLMGKAVAEAEETLLAVLAEKLYELLKSVSKVPRRPSELVGYAYQLLTMALPDPREAAYVYQVYAEAAKGSKLVALSLAPESVSGAAYYVYVKTFKSIVEAVEELMRRGVEVKTCGPLRLALLCSGDVPLAPVERQLRSLGVIPSDAVGLKEDNGRYVALLESLLRVRGFKWLARALEKGCVEAEPGEVLAVVKPERCEWV